LITTPESLSLMLSQTPCALELQSTSASKTLMSAAFLNSLGTKRGIQVELALRRGLRSWNSVLRV
jgi:Lhr-like helicase